MEKRKRTERKENNENGAEKTQQEKWGWDLVLTVEFKTSK